MRLSRRDIGLLARFEFLALMRAPQGLLAAAGMLVIAGWAVSKLIANAEFVNGLASGSLGQEETILLATVKWLAGMDEALVGRIFVTHSPFLTILFVLLVFATPLLSMVAALDQNATDIGNRGIRFLLVRTDRLSLVVGRLLGTLVFWAGVQILLALVGVGVALALDDAHGAGTILLDGLWMAGGLTLASLPFIAFMSLCGVATGNPLLSATMGLGSYLAVALVGGLGGWLVDAMKAFRYLFPAPLRYDLMLGGAPEALLAALALLGYSVVYASLAGWIVHKRDL